MERRRHERFTVVDLLIYEQETKKPVGKVVNISASGLLVIATTRYEVGQRVNFVIPFRQAIQGIVNFEFKGEIKWLNASEGNPTNFSIGMAFAENPELQTMFIQQLVNIYGAT
ncbi:MAG: PilZ domain-containing protein [Anaerolineales bacterium]|nr:PilZ domain-containing protein [Anaerolineales bacterium]